MSRIINGAKPPVEAQAEERRPHPWIKGIGIAFLCLWLPAFVVQQSHLDVRLRMNAGEMVGWASVGQVQWHDNENNVHWVEGLRIQPASGSVREFIPEQFTDGIWAQIRAAVESRGVDRKELGRQVDREEYRRRWERFRRPDARFDESLVQIERFNKFDSFGPKAEPEIACRLRYAGFKRTVVYKWEELSPQDIDTSWHR
jgi:hypothetical protein